MKCIGAELENFINSSMLIFDVSRNFSRDSKIFTELELENPESFIFDRDLLEEFSELQLDTLKTIFFHVFIRCRENPEWDDMLANMLWTLRRSQLYWFRHKIKTKDIDYLKL